MFRGELYINILNRLLRLFLCLPGLVMPPVIFVEECSTTANMMQQCLYQCVLLVSLVTLQTFTGLDETDPEGSDFPDKDMQLGYQDI